MLFENKSRNSKEKHIEIVEGAEDLKAAFLNDEIKGIICAIGGDDTYRLVPYLLEDEEFVTAVQQNPKLFTGFSDTTTNHLMFHRLGMTTFYGPCFVCDLADIGGEMLPYSKRAFESYHEVIDNKDLPILYNVNFGHTYPRCIIPYGVKVLVDVEEKKIKYQESLFE